MQEKAVNETVLVENWIRGDDQSFDLLFRMHFSKLYQFALRHTNDRGLSEELVMDMMLKVWQQKYKIQAGTTSLAPFLFHILKAAIVDHYRKKKMEFSALETVMQEPESPEQADGSLITNQLRNLYEQGLEKLSPKQRLVLNMRRDRGMSYREIATELELSPKTVDKHLSDAVAVIRMYVAKFLTTWTIFFLLFLLS